MEKQFKQGYISDLEQKSLPDLVDIQRRQKAILANKRLLQTLPDKGEKIRHFLTRVDAVISVKEKQLQQRAKKSMKNESEELEDTGDNISSTSSPASDAMDSYVSALADKFDAQLCIETPVFKPCRTLAKKANVKAEPAIVVENVDDRDAVHLPHLRNKPPEVLPLTEIFKLQKEQDKKLKDLKIRPHPETAIPSIEVDESPLLESNVLELDAYDDHVEDDIDTLLL